jgi:hypothetical protein
MYNKKDTWFTAQPGQTKKKFDMATATMFSIDK